MKKSISILFFMLNILSFQKGYCGTITHIHICSGDEGDEMKEVDSTENYSGSSEHFVFYKGNYCCIQYALSNWDEINKVLEKYTSTVTYLEIDNPSTSLNKIIPITRFKKLKTIFFDGNDEDYDFDSIPEGILGIKSLRKIKLNMIDHSAKIKKQIKSNPKRIRVKILPGYMEKAEAFLYG
jgi:hypothetical protein